MKNTNILIFIYSGWGLRIGAHPEEQAIASIRPLKSANPPEFMQYNPPRTIVLF
jgi:hypothetical protein